MTYCRYLSDIISVLLIAVLSNSKLAVLYLHHSLEGFPEHFS